MTVSHAVNTAITDVFADVVAGITLASIAAAVVSGGKYFKKEQLPMAVKEFVTTHTPEERRDFHDLVTHLKKKRQAVINQFLVAQASKKNDFLYDKIVDFYYGHFVKYVLHRGTETYHKVGTQRTTTVVPSGRPNTPDATTVVETDVTEKNEGQALEFLGWIASTIEKAPDFDTGYDLVLTELETKRIPHVPRNLEQKLENIIADWERKAANSKPKPHLNPIARIVSAFWA